MLAEEEPQQKLPTKEQRKPEPSTASSEKKGFFQRLFGGGKDKPQQPEQSVRNTRERERSVSSQLHQPNQNVNKRGNRSRKPKDSPAVANFKQRLRKQGKANLDRNQQNVAVISETYTNPEKTAESKPLLDDLRVQTRKAGEIKAERKRLERELVLQGGTELTAGEAGMGGAIRHNSQRKAEIEAKLEQVKQLEDTFLAEYPLASLLNTKQVDDSVSDKQLQQHLSGRLGKITESIEQTKQGLDNGDIPIEELDGLIPSVLAETPEHERAEVEKYIEGKLRRDAQIKTATTVGSLGLTVGALAAAPVTAGTSLSGVPLALSGLGTILGLGGSAYNFERANDLNRVAKTQDAGGNQLLTDPGAAKQDYVFAWVDLALGLIDGGLAVREGGQVLKGVNAAKKLATASTSDLVSVDKLIDIQKAVDLERAGNPAAPEAIAALRKELGTDFDPIYQKLQSDNYRIINEAEIDLISGGGQIDSPFAGKDFNSLSPQEKAVLEQGYIVKRKEDGTPYALSRRKVKDGYPAIHLEKENGQLIIKNGPAKNGSNRISNANDMKTNYKAVHGDIPDGHQLHHIIPDNVVQKHPLAKEARKRGYDLDRATNLEALPSYGKPGELVHRGPHKEWDRHVERVLNDKRRELLQDPRYNTVEDIPDKALEQAFKSAERKLRKDLLNTQLGLQEGWLKQEPTGLKLSENENSDDTETA